MSSLPTALISLAAAERATFFPAGREAGLRALLPEADWVDPSALTPAEWQGRVREISPQIVVSCWQTPRLPTDATGVRYLCHLVGSVRGVAPRELIAGGLRATNWGGVAAPLVAEHALLLTLGALRSLPKWNDFMTRPHSHIDKDVLDTRSLRGRRVSIHGFGQIARELVKLLRPFEVTISAFSIGVPEAFMIEHGVRPAASLQALAADADVFVSCEALTERTRQSIDRPVLEALPAGAVFVNVGRGAVVDEAALADVAMRRGLRVACDVFAVEPLPPDSPMRALPGSLYSPHIAGPTLDWYPRCGDLAIENIDRYLTGRPLLNEMSLDVFDRST